VTITENLRFITEINMFVSDSKEKVYQIIDPDTSLPYCHAVKFEIIDLKKDGKSSSQ